VTIFLPLNLRMTTLNAGSPRGPAQSRVGPLEIGLNDRASRSISQVRLWHVSDMPMQSPHVRC